MSRDGTAVLESNGLVWMGKGSGPAIVEQSLFGSPEALSSDGTTVVGESPVLVTGCGSISRWTASEVEALGMVFLGSGSFVSGDGTAIAGTTSGPTCANGPTNAFFWRPGNLMVLPQIGGLQDAAALGLSDDGSTVIGRAWTPPSDAGPLFRFSSATGVTTLGSPNGTVTSPVFTSASGSAFAGTAHDQSGNAFGFAWTVGSGFTALPKVPARGQSLVFGLSADGTVVLGLGTNAPGSPLLIAQDGFPFTWTAGGGLILLQGLMPGMIFESIVMAADASSIVGNLAPVTMGPPVIWDANRKPRSLFTDAPMFLARCRPVVRYVSADAKTFAGACDATGRKRGFVARF
jgi:uncharacterized membrane protein